MDEAHPRGVQGTHLVHGLETCIDCSYYITVPTLEVLQIVKGPGLITKRPPSVYAEFKFCDGIESVSIAIDP